MPKLLDITKLIAAQVNNNELSAAVGASEPWNVEISEEEFDKAKQQIVSLMTFDNAVNNQSVLNALKDKVDDKKSQELKKSIYSNIEDKISEKLGSKFSINLSGKRIDDQISAIEKVTLGKSDNDDLTKEINSLHEQLASKEKEIESISSKHLSDFTNFKIESKLKDKLNGIVFKEHYQDAMVKNGIHNSIINEVKNKAEIRLTDEGNLALYQKDNPELELYGDNNKKLGVDDIINPLAQPYMQVNKPQGGGEKPAQSFSASEKLPDGIHPTSSLGLTVHQQAVKY